MPTNETHAIEFQATRIRNVLDTSTHQVPSANRILRDVAKELDVIAARTFPSESDKKLLGQCESAMSAAVTRIPYGERVPRVIHDLRESILGLRELIERFK